MSTTCESNFEGVRIDVLDAPSRRRAIDAAFDYRGDVTMALASGEEVVGYLFHRDWTRGDGIVGVFPKDGGPAIQILAADVLRVAFTGRDVAAFKSSHGALNRPAHGDANT